MNMSMSVEDNAMEESEGSEDDLDNNDDCEQKLEKFKSFINNEFFEVLLKQTGETNRFRNVYPLMWLVIGQDQQLE